MKYGKVSLSDTVTDKDNEDRLRDENGKFLSVVATVASTDNDKQGSSTYSKKYIQLLSFRGYHIQKVKSYYPIPYL